MLGVHQAFGWAFAERSAAYLDFLSRLDDSQRFGLAWRVAAAACVACLPAIAMFRKYMRPRDGLVHLRGPRRHSGKEAAKLLKAALAKRVARRPDHEIAPGIAYPSDLWCCGVFIVAKPGAGKSTVIYPMAQKAIEAGDQALMFDMKGEFTAAFEGAGILGPWDARSLFWDIAKDMRNKGDMRRFAAKMIPSGHDPMWAAAARQVLVGFLMMLKAEMGDGWGWSDVARLMSTPMANLLPIMERHNKEAVRAVERASVTTAGIMINLAAFCSTIFDLADAWGGLPPERGISFVEWTMGRSPHRQIILQGHGSYEELTKGYVACAIEVVSGLIASVEMDDDPGWKMWFFCDEAARMGAAPLDKLCATGRSRNFRSVIATQDPVQLEEVHGAGAVRSLLSMCGTIVVGQLSSGDTAEAMAKSFGSREVERANVSTSRGAGGERSSSLSWAREEIALYRADELSSRLGLSEDGKSVRLAVLTGGQAYELDFPIRERAKLRPAHVPAQWTLGVDVGMGPRDADVAAAGGGAEGSGEPRPASGVAPPVPKGPTAAAAGSGPEVGGEMLRWLESSGALDGIGKGEGSAAGKSAARAMDALSVAAKPSGSGYADGGSVSSIGEARSRKPQPKQDGLFRLDRLPAPTHSDIERLARESLGPRRHGDFPAIQLFPNGDVEFKKLGSAKPAPDESKSRKAASAGSAGAPRRRIAAEMERLKKRAEPAGPAAPMKADNGRPRRRAMATFASLVFRSVVALSGDPIGG